jgi:hypothetical protein
MSRVSKDETKIMRHAEAGRELDAEVRNMGLAQGGADVAFGSIG